MADPVTIAIVGGLALMTAGVISSANAQRAAGQEEQAALNMQAQALDRQATEIEEQGATEELASRARLNRLLASQRALYAKAGVDLSAGSPLTVLSATAAEGEKEALNIRLGAARRAQSTRTSAGLKRYEGGVARAAGKRAATTTLLTGLGRVATSAAGSFRGGGDRLTSGTPTAGGGASPYGSGTFVA